MKAATRERVRSAEKNFHLLASKRKRTLARNAWKGNNRTGLGIAGTLQR
jgi:hypothetical protein